MTKSKWIVLASWIISIAFFSVTIIEADQFLDPDLMQIIGAGLSLIASFIGWTKLPEALKTFIKKLIPFIFNKIKGK